MAKCKACSRETKLANSFCVYHEQAYNNLKKKYDAWCDAYGKLSWEEYLKRLLKLKETGSWVNDVINLELKEKRGV